MQSCWGLLVGRLTGKEDVLFGVVDSGRPPELAGAESMIGMFANTVPARLRIAYGASLVDLARSYQQAQIELLPHRQIGLPQIHRLCGLDRLFDTAVMVQNHPIPRAGEFAARTGLNLLHADVRNSTEFPLALIVLPGHQLELRLQYRREYFAPDQAERLADGLLRLLSIAAEGNAQPVAVLDPLPDYGSRRSAEAASRALAGAVPSLERLLGRYGRDRQDRTGVRTVGAASRSEAMSARHLEERANRLAHLLLQRGIRRGAVVGLALPRTTELLASVLAVLKIGAAYLPIDPDHPAARVRLMTEDAKPELVLATEGTAAAVPDEALVLLGDQETEGRIAGLPVTEPGDDARGGPLDAGLPAYVIYTSGSTGRPKGVVIPRGALANLLHAMVDVLRIGPSDRVLATTTFGFDIAMLELLAPCASGAELVLVDGETARDPQRLAQAITDADATVIQATPSHWQALVDTEPGCLEGRHLIVGGEALGRPLAEALCAAGARAVNAYGPTEATVWATCGAVDLSLPVRRRSASRSVTIACTCWTARCVRCLPEFRGICTLPELDSPTATLAVPCSRR